MLNSYLAKLKTKQKLKKNIIRYKFRLLEPKTIDFKAGQCLLLDVKSGFRHYSISSSPTQNKILETVVDITPMGIGSQFLLNLKVGDKVTFRAPLGIFTLLPTFKPKIFLATGTGIVPLLSMFTYLTETKFKQKYELFWGLPKKDDIYLAKRLALIHKQNPNFNYTFCLSKDNDKIENCSSGHIQNILLKIKAEFPILDTEFYLCGRSQTIDSIKDFLKKTFKVPDKQILYEKFA